MRGTLAFAVPTAEEELGHRPEHPPEDRVALYRERVERIIASVGSKAVAWDQIEVTIFDEIPPTIRVRPARHDFAPAMIDRSADPCPTCGGVDFRKYTGRMDVNGRRRVDLRCVACSRMRTRRSWEKRRARAVSA